MNFNQILAILKDMPPAYILWKTIMLMVIIATFIVVIFELIVYKEVALIDVIVAILTIIVISY